MVALVILGVLLFVVTGLVAYAAMIYNGLVVVKNNILKAWANIDVLLKQRHDEIPKLIKTCEAYMKFEKDTLSRVIELRTQAQGATGVGERAGREAALSIGLQRLFAVAENYPDLKSQASFQQLQGRISELENQIADRRSSTTSPSTTTTSASSPCRTSSWPTSWAWRPRRCSRSRKPTGKTRPST